MLLLLNLTSHMHTPECFISWLTRGLNKARSLSARVLRARTSEKNPCVDYIPLLHEGTGKVMCWETASFIVSRTIASAQPVTNTQFKLRLMEGEHHMGIKIVTLKLHYV